MTFVVVSLLVLTTLSAVSVGQASIVQDVCKAGTRHYSPPDPVLLALRPPTPGLTVQDTPCVCQLLSPHPLNLSLLLAASLHPTGEGLKSGHLSISLGNETFNFTSVEEGQTLLNTSPCQSSGNDSNGMASTNPSTDTAWSTSSNSTPPRTPSPCLNVTLTLRQAGTTPQLLLFKISPVSNQQQPTNTADDLTIECQDAKWEGVTAMSIGAEALTQAPTSNTDLVQMSNSIMAVIVVAVLTLLVTLALLLLLLFRRNRCNRMQKSWVQEDCNKEEVTQESPPNQGGSISGGWKREGRQKHTPAPNVHSVISNLSSDVFLDEDGPHVTGSPPRGGRHSSGGRDPFLRISSTSPNTERRTKASAGSNCSHLGKPGDGRGPSNDPRDRPRVPSPSPHHRALATLPALPPSPAPPTPDEEQNEEWYGNKEVENAVQSRSASLDNIYEDPDEARPSPASTTKATTKSSVKVVPLKGARVQQERKGAADQGKELPKIVESPTMTAAPPSPGYDVQADTTHQPRSRPRTPQSPADNQESNPQLLGLQKPCSREDVKTSSEENLLLTTPTTGAAPSIQTEEGGQGKTPTPTRSRDASPPVPTKTRSRNKSLDSLDSNAGLSLLFPDSGRTSKASMTSLGETLELAQVESKEDDEEEEEVYQNYSVQKQASTQEAKKEQAASSPKTSESTVVLIDNELYESSTPALKSGSSTTDNPFALAMRNELFLLSSAPAQPPATGCALPTANHTGKTTPETPQNPMRSDGCVLEDNILYESSASLLANK